MKPKDIFKLAVRLLGLWFFYLGVTNLPLVSMTSNALGFVLVDGAAAWWLLGGASLLVDRAYPASNVEPQRSDEIPGGTSAKVDA